MISRTFDLLREPKPPPGITSLKYLGGGHSVGRTANGRRVVLYDADGAIAHIDIQVHDQQNSISLHTQTDRGEVGGQGHMTAMFADTLKLVKERFSQYGSIEMSPAPGAATKGLVSALTRTRLRMPSPVPLSQAQKETINHARGLLVIADGLRAARKQDPQPPRGAQEWDSELMKETTYELNALAEVEKATPTGLTIVGLNAAFNQELVGPNASERGAWAWYHSAEALEPKQGMLSVNLPMASVDPFLAAL